MQVFKPSADVKKASPTRGRKIWNVSVAGLAAIVLFMSTVQWFGIFGQPTPLPEALRPLYFTIASTRSFNRYGLFATMTTSRLELTIEGSRDSTNWKPYSFRWKPNSVEDGLPIVAPHMPRLDWQLWFTALTPPESNRNAWLQRLCTQLLLGNNDVLHILDQNPFPDRPPQWIRVRATEYRFTTLSERHETGNVWKAEGSRLYWPPMQLSQ